MPDDTAAELASLRGSVERLEKMGDRLEKMIGRFCVVAERILPQQQHNETQAGKRLAELHPNMRRIKAEVAAAHQRMRR